MSSHLRKLQISTLLLSALAALPVTAGVDDIVKTPEEIALEQKIKACAQTLKETGFVTADDKLIFRYCETRILSRGIKKGRLAQRIINERTTELNPFVITPHKQSYILPFTISDRFNRKPYESNELISGQLEEYESKYQISFKVPLRSSTLFIPGDGLYFAMTIQAWWQVYSDEISKPFRETNYTPEIFYVAPLPWKPNDGNMAFTLHFEHQSNGQTQLLSRSWNRILASVVYEKDDFAVGIKPWYRLKENEKTSPLDPSGDDNPDIHKFLGYYELFGAYAFNDQHKLSFNLRNNWNTGNGSIELNYSFPFPGSSRLVGFAQYFSGYGESLIDYNHKQQKIGFGIAVNDIF
ncbi:phospholipase A [Psychrosphaera aestuarii]|uniref:phospholipase A n=1 Tax=Psychrosphaera aestuarii TaxID=1266052 RepID=UPI001B32E1B5|nr:phospholipase A [Psychrosphaera aestuarii]